MARRRWSRRLSSYRGVQRQSVTRSGTMAYPRRNFGKHDELAMVSRLRRYGGGARQRPKFNMTANQEVTPLPSPVV